MDWINDENFIKIFVEHDHNLKKSELDDYNSFPYDFEQLLKASLIYIKDKLDNQLTVKQSMRTKNNEESLKWREEGNKLFSSKLDPEDFWKCLEYYAKSIAYGVPGSKAIALAYASRSGFLLHVNRPKECLEDIERALESSCPEKLKPKLLIRMAECYSKLSIESYIDAKFWLNDVPVRDTSRECLDKMLSSYQSTQANVVDEECLIPTLESQNEKYPCASDAVDVQFSKAMGRHIVATRDIKVGEILVVERPYFRYLKEKTLYTHCSYCTGPAFAGIPCDACVNFIYCSNECKAKAWSEYHHWECILYDLLTQCKTNFFGQVRVIKLFIQLYHENGGLQKLKERVTTQFGSGMESTNWEIKGEWYKNSSLESFLCLISHEKSVIKSQCLIITFSTIRILFFLLTCTDIFGVQYDRDKIPDVDIILLMLENPHVAYFGRLLVKLTFIALINSYGSSEIRCNGRIGTRVSETFPFLSLINHSCIPNSFIQFKRNCSVMYAKSSIRKGEQICHTYGPTIYNRTKSERQSFLNNYQFTCDCVACSKNFPRFDHSNKKYDKSIEKLWRKSQRTTSSIEEMYRRVVWLNHYDETEELIKNLKIIMKVISKQIGPHSPEMSIIQGVFQNVYQLAGNRYVV